MLSVAAVPAVRASVAVAVVFVVQQPDRCYESLSMSLVPYLDLANSLLLKAVVPDLALIASALDRY